jgi:hypothetical protein
MNGGQGTALAELDDVGKVVADGLNEGLGSGSRWTAVSDAGQPEGGGFPVHRSESPTGYSSAGCSPGEPVSASPVTDNSSLIPSCVSCDPVSRWSCPPAMGVSSLLCASGDISSVTGPCWSTPLSHDGVTTRFVQIRTPSREK